MARIIGDGLDAVLVAGGSEAPPQRRRCNRHEDCDAADEEMRAYGRCADTHCTRGDCPRCAAY